MYLWRAGGSSFFYQAVCSDSLITILQDLASGTKTYLHSFSPCWPETNAYGSSKGRESADLVGLELHGKLISCN